MRFSAAIAAAEEGARIRLPVWERSYVVLWNDDVYVTMPGARQWYPRQSEMTSSEWQVVDESKTPTAPDSAGGP